ncbi:undecaprenyldiphospho-muramoylpentapeptide beta-N-acetylglucosaminyltransferase [Mesonia aestuariivivens]|uniref:UDP-N-acetylglucosamine--N-acetylmuramyl-(pentapeptide) pyrophosphoryl-undecaprenol N-acetylglucosamine transferase n=1 Tax=Mesonia aestuariivivens TaxID=2796128 RepID=A0ABS6W489_9FLAO|nr:undecaprenyldiphospho-muramoylpentapeptide beta-N-acetylglucosaminyltransferase [Mesonia aestuariivivens]MBW2962634.1 undecaprenyldiphospho-muramoylpentapeptide beta-N-acetylglucosaminyltransferase [Mesonia aestuariivivens]
MRKLKFILSGGGTGGHIYPAVAIADELKRRHPNAEFLFVGAQDRMEMQKIPQAGYQIEGLWISGIQRKLTLQNLAFPFKLFSSLRKSRKIIKNFQPDVVVGTGGFASGPLLKVANQKNIPTVLQEQNSFAGITNKWLANQANKICVAYAGMENFFPKEKIKFTGNPVRQDLIEIAHKENEAQAFFKLVPNKKTILILGGSLGAKRINELVEANLTYFEENSLQVVWQTGKLYFEKYKKYQSKTIQVHEFLNRMDLAYSAADIIISRAGAGSVSELCMVAKPVLFIPSPNVAEDHQAKNALSLVKEDAALMLKETQLEEKFQQEFSALLNSATLQQKLATNILTLAKPNATKDIVDEIEKLIKK